MNTNFSSIPLSIIKMNMVFSKDYFYHLFNHYLLFFVKFNQLIISIIQKHSKIDLQHMSSKSSRS